MALTRSARLSRTMKSAPFFLNASTGAGAPLLVARLTVMRQLLPVRSGFCSEPESANSFLMMLWVRMNQE